MFFIWDLNVTIQWCYTGTTQTPPQWSVTYFKSVLSSFNIRESLNRVSPLSWWKERSRRCKLALWPSRHFWAQICPLSNSATCSNVYSCFWQIWKITFCKETKPAQTVTNNLKITGLTGCPNCWQKGNAGVCNKHRRWKPFPGTFLALKPLLWPAASPNDLWAEKRESIRKQLLLGVFFFF